MQNSYIAHKMNSQLFNYHNDIDNTKTHQIAILQYFHIRIYPRLSGIFPAWNYLSLPNTNFDLQLLCMDNYMPNLLGTKTIRHQSKFFFFKLTKTIFVFKYSMFFKNFFFQKIYFLYCIFSEKNFFHCMFTKFCFPSQTYAICS